MDLIAQAKTGSGKTAAFGIGLLNPINPRYFGCQALVMPDPRAGRPGRQGSPSPGPCRRQHQGPDPVRRRVPRPADRFAGARAHIIVGTPGRIQQHLRKGSLVLDGLNTLILDEADRMLDMGFYDAIEDIISKTPAPPDPAVLRHLPGGHQAVGLEIHARRSK
jgi:ATP-independent RNA helicase DbpA